MSDLFMPASVQFVYDTLLEKARCLKERERLSLLNANGYVLAEDIISPINIPPYDNSAMDGYALRHIDAEKELPISQFIAAGDTPTPLEMGTAARIFTGAPIPAGADTVIAQEMVQVLKNNAIQCTAQPTFGQYVRLRGEDVRAHKKILAAYKVLTPNMLGFAASIGVADLSVVRPLKVAIFFTGDELLEPGTKILPNKIYNTNCYWLHTRLTQLGCEVVDLGIIQDNVVAIENARYQAMQRVDVVLTCGGVSVGEKDFVKEAVGQLGELFLWKVAMKPGKPFAFGRIGNIDFMGLPGNPVSGLVAFELLVKPFLLARLGIRQTLQSRFIPIPAVFEISQPDSYREEFLRVRRKIDKTGLCLEKYPNQSSGVFSSCIWADGLARIHVGQTVKMGDMIDFLPW
jgi:molybdopterin molybdotransferase